MQTDIDLRVPLYYKLGKCECEVILVLPVSGIVISYVK